jgi:enediyne biosynthesis protein E4
MQRRFPIAIIMIGTPALIWLLTVGCSPRPSPTINEELEEQGPPWFEDVTEQVGLDFLHDCGPTGTYFMPQQVSSGGAYLFDFDGKGSLGIYLMHNAGPKSRSTNRLFRWRPDKGTFDDISAGSGLDIAGFCMGVAIGDVNNDGLPDVLITQYGGIKLFLNLGGGKFEDVSDEAGLSSPLWSTSAAFLDYNRDGRLDLIVVNYLDYDPLRVCPGPDGVRDYCSPKNFLGTCSTLFRNLGPGPGANGKMSRVRFEDVSVESGIGRIPGPGLGVVVADFNGDGWPDIFVSNDGKPNHLWINKRDGKFKEEAVSRNVAYTHMGHAYAGMGIAVGDVDNDGLLDLYVTHLGEETNTLWKQGPIGLFTDQTGTWGLLGTRWRGTGFGALMADFNNDGFLDIAIANGRVKRGSTAKDTGLGPFWETYADRNQILANTGDGKFRDISPQNRPFCGHWNVARGLACGDFNGDGAPDLLLTTIGDKARLFKNVAPERGHWLKVRAWDPNLNRDAYGAQVTVRSGTKRWFRVLNPAESYLSSGSPIAHFGLGATQELGSIEVLWPDGPVEQALELFDGGSVDRSIVLKRGSGRKP